MPPQEQADLWMALRDRMKNDWHELTLQERKAGESPCLRLSTVIFAPGRSACVLRLINAHEGGPWQPTYTLRLVILVF